MNSSISSSKLKARKPGWRHLGVFAGVFLLLVAGGVIATRTVEALAAANLAMPEDGPAGNWYVDLGPGINSWSHSVFYYGIGETISHVREADIVFVGSSRVLFAFPHEAMNAFTRTSGLKCFNLSFAHSESNVFAQEVMERNDIRPKIVVVNADRFFTDAPSAKAASHMGAGEWDTFKVAMESRAQDFYYRYGRRVFPHFLPDARVGIRPVDLRGALRSVESGAWFHWNWADRQRPVEYGTESFALTAEEIRTAERFRDFVRGRGGELVFTFVPTTTPHDGLGRAQELSKRLGVPFVGPGPLALMTIDDSHLSATSAEVFAEAFLRELATYTADGGP